MYTNIFSCGISTSFKIDFFCFCFWKKTYVVYLWLKIISKSNNLYIHLYMFNIVVMKLKLGSQCFVFVSFLLTTQL